MSSQHKRFLSLLDRLLHLSRDGLLSWSETADEETFRTVFKGGMVNIARDRRMTEEGERALTYYAELLNEDNAVVEEFLPAEDAEISLLADLYEAARSRARRSEDVFRKIESELQSRAASGVSR